MKVRSCMLMALLGIVPAVQAADFSDVDLDPLLRVRTRLTVPAAPPVATEEREDSDTFVTRGGATTIVRVVQLVSQGSATTLHQLARGVGSRERLSGLAAALAQGRIGQQNSCFIDAGNTPPDVYDITWYGKGVRRNTFVIVFGTPESSDLPACGPGVFPLLQGILRYESGVLGDPATEVLTND